MASVLVLVGLVVLVAAYGLLAVDKPRIESIENEWGAVNDDRSEVETEITVDNPFLLRVTDAAANIQYTVTLNGVQFASGREAIRLSGENDVIRTSTWVNNDRIPEWWVTHVNNNETSTVTVDPSFEIEYVGLSVPAEQWTRERTFRTDLLDPLETDQPRTFTAFDRTVFVVNETGARWGHATADRTPLDVSATVTNSLSVPLPVTDIEYTIRMNNIVVGQGEAAEQTLIPAGDTRTLRANASIDNARLDEWWVTHLRNDETTELSVSFDASIGFGGSDRRLPLEFISYNRTFHTDVFGSDAPGNQSESGSANGLPDPGDGRPPSAVGIKPG